VAAHSEASLICHNKFAQEVPEGDAANVYRGMNTTRMNTTGTVDWSGHIRLGLVLSIATAIAAVVLGGHVDETTFIVAVTLVSSIASWARVPRIASRRCVNARHEIHRFRRGYCRREQVTLHRVAAHHS
jgi:hypothetical protein